MIDLAKRIVYPTGQGISVLVPCDCGLTIQQIAAKDVPAGSPYLIVDVADIPADRTYRAAWTCDFSQPDGFGLGHDAWQAANVPQPAPHVEPDLGDGMDRAYPGLLP